MGVNLPRCRVILDTFAFRNRSTDLLPRDSRCVPFGAHMTQPASLVLSRFCTDTKVSTIFPCTAGWYLPKPRSSPEFVPRKLHFHILRLPGTPLLLSVSLI